MKNLNISTSALSKICGVSQGTVDRALNNRPGIKLSTKQKILTAAKKFGYRAPIQANTAKVIGQIGIVVFNLNYAIQIYRKNRNVKIFGFDNISALDKYKLPISSVGYSAAQIAQGAADIIKNRMKDVFTVDYFIVER